MQHFGISLFEKTLCNGLSDRVTQFAKYVRKRFAENPELNQVKTNKGWMDEYTKWSENYVKTKKAIEDFLEETDNED